MVDAERFQSHPELSSVVARLTTMFEATVRASTYTTLVFDGGYANTLTPGDLNLATGLGAPRSRAWEWRGTTGLRRTLTPIVSLGAGYEFKGEFIPEGIRVETHEVDLWLRRQLGTGDEIRAKYVSGLFVFDPGETIPSETILLGSTRGLTDTVSVKFDGGVRHILGAIRPEIAATIAQRSKSAQVSLSYAVSHVTAIGLPAAIDVQSAQAEVRYHPSIGTQAAVQGGLFVNRVGTSTARVYRVSASVVRRINRTLSFSVGYAMDHQRGPLDMVPRADLPLGRNVLSVGLIVWPRSS